MLKPSFPISFQTTTEVCGKLFALRTSKTDASIFREAAVLLNDRDARLLLEDGLIISTTKIDLLPRDTGNEQVKRFTRSMSVMHIAKINKAIHLVLKTAAPTTSYKEDSRVLIKNLQHGLC